MRECVFPKHRAIITVGYKNVEIKHSRTFRFPLKQNFTFELLQSNTIKFRIK
jgi:hypothetical protein